MQQRKGDDGDREIAALVRDLTGSDVRRRIRQHEGDSDIKGVPGWCVEVKRHARATRSDVRGWWQQTARQGVTAGLCPVLFYRLDRDEWREVWPLSAPPTTRETQARSAYGLTVEGSIQAWAVVARGYVPTLGVASVD